jgi:hypothetical protein
MTGLRLYSLLGALTMSAAYPTTQDVASADIRERERQTSQFHAPWFSLSPPITFDPASLTLEFLTPSLDDFDEHPYYDLPTIAIAYSFGLKLAGYPTNSEILSSQRSR